MKLTHDKPLVEVACSLDEVENVRRALFLNSISPSYLDNIPIIFDARIEKYWGLAYSTHQGQPVKIRLRLELLRPEMRPHLISTFRHEVAHLLANKINPREAHGTIWKRCAVQLKTEPKACVSREAVDAMRQVKNSNLTVNFEEIF